ncbi:MAG: UDP-N-acetylglucosamine 1-carboxyvinyltransferase, partial [Phycisphaeraceae bacterium]|nr:UDP-N-acetylglucosamine 1-carboxyvinyltransferase [Phycisphaeraceae bacterium]
MDRFVIQGGRRLRGKLRVHGAKNAALPLMAAALLTDEPVVLRDVPNLVDIRNMGRLLEALGCPTQRDAAAPDRALTLHAVQRELFEAHYDIVRTMRASICVLGPLLARRG